MCLSGCRLFPGADWFQPGRHGFKGRLLPVPGGSPLLSKTASSCATVYMICLNKTILKRSLLVVLGGQEEGSLIFLLRQGFP